MSGRPSDGGAETAATLRPCPFCGAAAETVLYAEGGYFAACTATSCAEGMLAATAVDAATLWNSRIDDETAP